jgi:hypothetical protein
MKFPVLADAVERIGMTFILTIGAAATADGVNLADWGSTSFWEKVGFAGLLAAFTAVKVAVGNAVGKKGGSVAPQVGLEPVANGNGRVTG